MFGGYPTKNTKNMRGKQGENKEKHKRKHSTNKINHTCARFSKHNEIHDPNPTRDDT